MEILKHADPLADIAESLRILSGRTTLKEIRLMEELTALFDAEMNTPFDEREKIYERINELEDELLKERLEREGAK